MLSVLELIGGIIQVLGYLLDWRLSLCLFGSVAIAVVIAIVIPYEPLGWIVAGVVVLTGFVIGLRWDRAHR